MAVVVPDPGPCHRSSAAQNHPGGPGDAVVVPAGASSSGAAKAVRAVRGAAILHVETGREVRKKIIKLLLSFDQAKFFCFSIFSLINNVVALLLAPPRETAFIIPTTV